MGIDPTYSAVSAAIADASPGDTITLNAGSADWSSKLTVTKNVSIVGAGIGQTIIRNTGSEYLLRYSPANNTDAFRLSGCTFNLNNKAGFEFLGNRLNPPVYQLRFDHNRVYGGSGAGREVLWNYGCRGCIDNNIFEDLASTSLCAGWGDTTGGDEGLWMWQTFPELAFGAAHDNMYVEDNVMTFGTVGEECFDSERGGRYCYRYNTITVGDQSYPIWDLHNGAAGDPNLYSVMGGEIYGNKVTLTGMMIIVQHRGGRCLCHHNLIIASSYSDSEVKLSGGTPQTPYLAEQLPNASYYFLNRRASDTGTLLGMAKVGTYGDLEPCLIENTDWWKDAGSFDGSVGIGYGTSLPDCSGYAVGVGYWLTAQSISSLSGLVGCSSEVSGGSRSPSSYIQGTLYRVKDGSPKTWEVWATPYTYPHPLRSSGPPVGTPVLTAVRQ